MHKGRYGLKEIITKKEMEYDFVWIRKHYYTDLLKLFVCRDIDDYENYKLDLYFTLHFLNIIKETGKTPTLKYLKNDLLKCNKECIKENTDLAVNWYNKRVDNLFKNTEREGYIDKINIKELDEEEFSKFVIKYSNWLTKELCATINHEVSLGEVNRKINKLLHWDEVYEYKKKRAKEAYENGFAELFSGLCKDENIFINRNKQYNLSCDSLFDGYLLDLGTVFIELFHKVYYDDYENENARLKIIKEMQEIFDFVKRLGNTNGRNKMTDGEIRDIFLTAGDYPENLIYMSQNEVYLYDKFCTYLLCYEKINKSIALIEKL